MSYGPALPPHLLKKDAKIEEKKNTIIGPSLPPHLKEKLSESSPTDVPQNIEQSSNVNDDEIYGPLPPNSSSGSQAHQALEERALEMKLGYLDSNRDEEKVREEWMLELPDVGRSRLGLGPRQFRKNQLPDFSDRSSWTDSPVEKAKKLKHKNKPVDLKKETELKELRKRDEEQQQISERHSRKTKRDKSLYDIHQDTLKKKKKDEDEPTRRPFDREIDLKVNQFDDAQKKSILKKAMHLDDRFSAGQSKFL